jgi:membrane protein
MTADQPEVRGREPGERVARAREQAERAARWAEARVPGGYLVAKSLERERLAAAGLVAGGLAFRFFLWLVPFGLVLAAILSFWVREDRGGLEDAARSFGLSAVAARSASEAIAADSHARWYFLVLGLLLVLWFSLGALRALRIAHALAWGGRPEKLRRVPRAALAFNGVIVALMAVTAATAWLREELGVGGLLLTLLLVVVYVGAGLWVMTKLPHADAPWRALLPGAVLAAVGAQAMHLVVILYLAPKLGRSTELYGSLGAATVILLWLYLTARLIVAAAFLNAARWHHHLAEPGAGELAGAGP